MIDAPSSAWFTAHPHWSWLVVLYFFFGGLAGGCYVLAAVIDLLGRERDRPLARVGYLTVLPCLAISAVALIFDLSRPERFWHLLVEIHTWMPLIQLWTPLNAAAWVLMGFGLCAVLSSLGVRPPSLPGKVVSIIGLLLGLYVASYEGALLAFTSRPIWSETPLIGTLLVLTALSMAAAYLVLFGRWRHWELPGMRALQRIDAQALVVALIGLVALVVSLGDSARALLGAVNLILLAAVLILGFLAPLALRFRAGHVATAAALALGGGFLLRTLIVFSPQGIGQ
ncbi:MAG TPA: NrfD/PsrC family molybdoenzyme membrane anchor subunit [Burkholderiales bacterium]|nr:NrfD/PsrC family molybdoenzyme membrane anchor subunit [Burkholderiales bacterium]